MMVRALAGRLLGILSLGVAWAVSADETAPPPVEATAPAATASTAAPSGRADLPAPGTEALLAQQLRPEQVLWLEAEGKRFLAVIERERVAARQGVAVVLVDRGQTAASPGLPAALRAQLPDTGWLVLSIGIPEALPEGEARAAVAPAPVVAESAPPSDATSNPDLPVADTPAATTPEAAAPVTIDLQGRSAAPADQWRQDAAQRLAAAIEWAGANGYQNHAVIGIGAAAQPVLDLLVGAKARQDGLGAIFVAPAFTERDTGSMGERLGKGFALPVLDLDALMGDAKAAQQQRLGEARRNQFVSYEVGLVPMTLGDSPVLANTVTQRISGWLRENLKGEEKKQTVKPTKP